MRGATRPSSRPIPRPGSSHRACFPVASLLFTVLVAAPGCRLPPPETGSTVELLERTAARIGPELAFAGEPKVVSMLWKYRQDRSPDVFELRLRLAHALVRVRRTGEAVDLYDELLDDARTLGLDEARRIDEVEFPRAVAYFRLGEEENCLARHNSESCLYPIRGRAVHCQPRGSLGAIAALEAILERRPDDLVSKWLLHIATMTLGRDPETVRPAWRLERKPAGSQPDVEPFTDVAGPLGLAGTGISGGCILDDFDNDGYLDVMASSMYPIDEPWGQLRLYKNDGNGSFTDVTRSAGLEGIRGGLNIIQADYDNNGFIDVLVLRGAWQMNNGRWPNTLLRNEGYGTFADVTASSGVLDFAATQAAAWGDFDNDGWIDLFVGNETAFPRDESGWRSGIGFDIYVALWSLTHPQVQGHLYHNQGDGTFLDRFDELGFSTQGWVKGAAWGDYNRDGRADLYLSRFGSPNLLYRNDGPDGSGGWTFTEVAEEAGVTEPFVSFATWFWDYDNDGWDDIFVAGYPRTNVRFPGDGLPIELVVSARNEIVEFLGEDVPSADSKPRLFRNRGDGAFEDVTRAAGLWKSISCMGVNFGDLDNDGWLDMYLGTGAPPFEFLVPNRAFLSTGAGAFLDVTEALKLGSLAKGHGVGFGDIDNDGDQDIFTVLGGAFPGDTFPDALFLNPGRGNDWITLKLEGVRANRSAIGARIELTLSGASGTRRLFRTAGSGGSFGASSIQQEVGLGRLIEDGGAIEDVTITWPNRARTVQRLGPLAANAIYHVREGEPARRVELDVLRLRKDEKAPEPVPVLDQAAYAESYVQPGATPIVPQGVPPSRLEASR